MATRWLLILMAVGLCVPGCRTGAKDYLTPISLEEPIQSIRGPKRTVAVGEFATLGSMSAKYGDFSPGGGMSAMLVTALMDTGKFIVLERAQIDAILAEQQMVGEGVSAAGTGPDMGRLFGAQFLILGSITEFGDDFKGGGKSAGASSEDPDLPGGAAYAREKSQGKIGMDIRIVDTTTGAILSSFRVEEPIMKKGYDASVDVRGFSLGSNKFMRTPLGGASRRAIMRAVAHVAEAAGKTAWVGRVVDVEGLTVYINAGSRAGLKVGERFMIERVLKRYTDPVTKQLLSVRKKELGMFEVDSVEEKIAYGTFLPTTDDKPKRNDLVVMVPGSD
jgi:curli biogenesis system outer membrane secretion channel CsgG